MDIETYEQLKIKRYEQLKKRYENHDDEFLKTELQRLHKIISYNQRKCGIMHTILNRRRREGIKID